MFLLFITKYMKQMTKTPTKIFQNNDEAIEILGYCNPITINIDLKTRKLTYTNDCVRTWIPLFATVNDVLVVAVKYQNQYLDNQYNF